MVGLMWTRIWAAHAFTLEFSATFLSHVWGVHPLAPGSPPSKVLCLPPCPRQSQDRSVGHCQWPFPVAQPAQCTGRPGLALQRGERRLPLTRATMQQPLRKCRHVTRRCSACCPSSSSSSPPSPWHMPPLRGHRAPCSSSPAHAMGRGPCGQGGTHQRSG